MKKWVIAAIGTIVVALISAWMLYIIGPDSDLLNIKGAADGLDWHSIKEEFEYEERKAREVAKRTGKDTTNHLAALKASIWLKYVSYEGKEGKTYVSEIDDVKHRVYVGTFYTDDQGVKCRAFKHVVEPHPNWTLRLIYTYTICEGKGFPNLRIHHQVRIHIQLHSMIDHNLYIEQILDHVQRIYLVYHDNHLNLRISF